MDSLGDWQFEAFDHPNMQAAMGTLSSLSIHAQKFSLA
jgi:hypothetical protein